MPMFELGTVVANPAALDPLRRANQSPDKFLRRHASGDWGDLCPSDKALNREALRNGSRIFSAYEVEGRRFYVITESDRAVTTVLLADEY